MFAGTENSRQPSPLRAEKAPTGGARRWLTSGTNVA